MRANIVSSPSVNGIRVRGISGFGKGMGDTTDTSGDTYNVPDLNTSNDSTLNWIFGGAGDTTPISTTNGTTVASSANFGSIISSITSSFSNIFKTIQPVPNGCSQVQTLYGSSTTCNSGASAAQLLGSMGIGGFGGGTLLLLGGGALLLMLMMKK